MTISKEGVVHKLKIAKVSEEFAGKYRFEADGRKTECVIAVEGLFMNICSFVPIHMQMFQMSCLNFLFLLFILFVCDKIHQDSIPRKLKHLQNRLWSNTIIKLPSKFHLLAVSHSKSSGTKMVKSSCQTLTAGLRLQRLKAACFSPNYSVKTLGK